MVRQQAVNLCRCAYRSSILLSPAKLRKNLSIMLQTLRQVKDRRAQQNMRNAMKAQAQTL